MTEYAKRKKAKNKNNYKILECDRSFWENKDMFLKTVSAVEHNNNNNNKRG